MMSKLLQYIPHGNTLDETAWRKRHDLLSLLLLLHVPGLFLFGVALGRTVGYTAWAFGPPLALLVAGRLARNRRVASFFVTVGLVYCSAALVGLSRGSIEAHFHFFIIIGFIALYQDWVPFLWNIAFTVLSHGLGSGLQKNLIFNHPAGQGNPWLWSAIHGLAVMFACGGVVIFWRANEQEQQKTLKLATELADAEVTHRRFTSELLVNLARRNQSLLYRQLHVINQLEDQEEDPDALADLFHLDHLATRIRRNAESLLVLSGEQPPRVWSKPVPLLDVVRAAIAETDDLDRVVFNVDERATVSGNAVADLTHMLAELVENAVHFSPPESSVSVRTRPHLQHSGGWVLTVEDWGVGLPAEDLAAANELLAAPGDVDLSVSQRLGLHVIARLAQRHGVQVSLSPTPGGGITAVVVLPPDLFSEGDAAPVEPAAAPVEPAAAPVEPAAAEAVPVPSLVALGAGSSPSPNGGGEEPAWQGWWQPPAGGHLAAQPGPDRESPDGPWADLPEATRQVPDEGLQDRPAAGLPAAGLPAAGLPAADRRAQDWPPANLPAADEPVQDRQALRRSLRPAAPASVSGLGEDWSEAAVQAAPGTAGTPPPLTRRVPQAHLAPELRRQDGAAAPSPVTPPAQRLPNAAQARAALARYQASREAARAVVEDRTADGSERP
jgi:signal transduction histidine kinase